MPYTIKKKVRKTQTPAADIEEVRNIFSQVFEEKRKGVLWAVGIIVAVAVLGMGVTGYRAHRLEKAVDLQNQALAAFYDTANPSDRYERALDLFQEAESIRPTTLSRVYTAETYLKSGQAKEAEAVYEKYLSGHADEPIASAVRLKVALLKVAEGNRDAAIQGLEALQQDTVVGDTALHELSVLYAEAGEEGKRMAALKTLVGQFPDSVWAPEALATVEAVEGTGTKEPHAEGTESAPQGEAR